MSSNDHGLHPTTQATDSLVRRLAGPSTNKAGLAKDQTEINRIIAEASKGSKFYENEKRKDKDLTERIERIIKYRDEVIKGVDLHQVEQGVDKLIAQLEAQRDLSQVIVHVDMDAFFASVELLDNPDLASKPFGVGGGVMSTASYEARKYGVRSGMPTFIAKKLCPDLIVLKSHYDRYSEMSNKVMAVCRRYDPNMSVVGCDEGYLNITSYCEEHGMTPDECVQDMRQKIHEETALTASAGIAPNKMLAKICSDRNKPNGQFKLDFEARAIKAFMRDLSIRKVPGVGRVNERLLESIGIKTCGDIYAQRGILSLMDKQFGLMFLLQSYLGIASNVVEPWQREEKKSIGAERTFNTLSDTAKIHAKLEEVAAELSKDMTEGQWTGKTITLKYKLNTFQVCTRAKSLDKWLSGRAEELFTLGKELLKPELPLTLRLIGLRVTKLKDLKAEAESKARGIKRFFNAASPSPSKKHRIERTEHDEQEEELPLSQDGFATSMPGYEDEIEAEHIAEEDVIEGDNIRSHRPPDSLKSNPKSSSAVPDNHAGPFGSARPPNSDRGSKRKPSSSASVSAATHKPSGAEDVIGSPEAFLECPICSKMLEMDNQGLNEHIDFCLSKQAIKEAQASSLKPDSGSSQHGTKTLRRGHKPQSRGKSKDKVGGHGEGLLRFRKQD
ncbi:DNA/RNA polymerase [Dichomitus squalens]|uniref:DNA polymerase kappa n=1 Tax=Dichomitus squalens TaxID=114155 RepID=A0A4V2K1Q1_9APHY|nr:DNA/RNA polymerase [Dichomitus squalens]